MSQLEYWVWFSSLRNLRSGTRQALLERFGDPAGIFFAEEQALRSAAELRDEEYDALTDRDLSGAADILRRCDDQDVRLITLRDAAYPQRLRNIPDPPDVLYVQGRLPDVDALPVITMVGTRKCTPYGLKMARKLAYEITEAGGVVCSGLTAGNDTAAAQGALMAGGPVIGVLGTAIDAVYPKWNGSLFEDVKTAGALLSEYPPGVRGQTSWFRARNRVMAGLGVATLVVEAPAGSGALLTADHALDFGRDVFAIPGNSDAPNSHGSNNLLREGAAIAESGWDVLQAYIQRFPGRLHSPERAVMPGERAAPAVRSGPKKPAAPEQGGKPEAARSAPPWRRKTAPAPESSEDGTLARQLEGLSATQLKITGVMTKPGMHVDDIVDLSCLPAATVLSDLTMLQIKGYVRQESGKRFTLNIGK